MINIKKGIIALLAVLMVAVTSAAWLIKPLALAFAEEEVGETITEFAIDYDHDLLEVDTLTYYFDGMKMEYCSSGFVNYTDLDTGEVHYHMGLDDDSSKALYRMTRIPGVEHKHNIMAGYPNDVMFFALEPYRGIPEFVHCSIVEANIVACDVGTDINVSMKYKTGELESSVYIKEIGYKAASLDGISDVNRIDSAVQGDLGEIHYNLDYLDTDSEWAGYYGITINTFYTFRYKLVNGGFEINVLNNPRAMTIVLQTEKKLFDVNIQGDAASIASVSGGNEEGRFEYLDSAEIVLSPEYGTIIKSVEIFDGTDKVLSLYGGMQTDGSYFFAGGNEYENKFSFGNYALGYEAIMGDGLLEEEYISTQESFMAVIERAEKNDFSDYFTVSIDDSGVVTITKENIDRDITIIVSVQEYLQVNLFKKADELSEPELSIEPFYQIVLGGVVFDDDYAPRLFVVGFTSPVDLVITLNIGYSYDESVDFTHISGNVFAKTFESGEVLDIMTYLDDACSLSIKLMSGGNMWESNDTKIYIAMHDEDNGIDISGDTEEERIAKFKALLDTSINSQITSYNGKGEKKEIPSGTKVYVCVRISPYFMMTTSEGGEDKSYAYEYCKEIMVTDVMTITFEMDYLSFEGKQVLYTDSSGEEHVWNLKIEVGEDASGAGGIAYIAQITNGEGIYANIRKDNPKIVGYNFANLGVGGITILTLDASGNFVVDKNDVASHLVIAKDIFSSPYVDALFDAKLYEFSVEYLDASGETVTLDGKIYHDSKDLILSGVITPPEEYLFFGGVSYLSGMNPVRVYTSGDYGYEEITEGEFAGLIKYELAEKWTLENSGTFTVEAFFLNKSYVIEVVYVYPDGTTLVQQNIVEYGSTFMVSDFRKDNPDFETPNIEGLYNLVGWQKESDESISYVIDGVQDYQDNKSYTYDVVGDIRIVPVFSAKMMTITFYDGTNALHEVVVSYDSMVDLDELLKVDGEFIVPNRYAYTFLGFYNQRNDGDCVIFYSEEMSPVYEVNFAGNMYDEDLKQGLFGIEKVSGEDVFVWKLQDNLSLYVRWDADFLQIDVSMNNGALRDSSVNVEMLPYSGQELSDTWEVEDLQADNKFVARDFIVTDSFKLVGFKPLSHHYISALLIGGVEVYKAYTNANGEVVICEGFSTPSYFDPTNGEFDILASNFFTEENGLSKESIYIEYSVVTQVVTFRAVPKGDDGRSLANITSTEQKYLVSYYYNNLDSIDNWLQLDEDGVVVGAGWVNLQLQTALEFDSLSLYGDASLSIIADNGTKYYFRGWKNTESGEFLPPDIILEGELCFETVFSVNFDVEVNYYVYSTFFNSYIHNTKVGQFWVYDKDAGEYVMSPVLSLNAFEVQDVDGFSKYIKCWSTRASNTAISFSETEVASYINLNTQIDIDYQNSRQVFNLYAVYENIKFSYQDSGNVISSEVEIPNDSLGNTYSEKDVLFITMSEFKYDELLSVNMALRDLLTSYYQTEASLTNVAINVSTAGKITDTEIAGSGRELSSTYLLMVVVRKGVATSSGKPYIYFACVVDVMANLLN